MATERELKFSLIDDVPTAEEVQTIFRQKGYELIPQGTQKHFDIYFDDSHESLQKAGMALRKRRTNNKVLATLKANPHVSGELHEREEIEELMLGSNWPEEIFKRVEPVTDPWNVLERLELATLRTHYLVKSKHHDVAVLSFDAVTANYPGVFDTVSFEEVEIEALAETSETELRAIADVLDRLIKLTPNNVNKLERAEALLNLSRAFHSADANWHEYVTRENS